MAVNRDGHPMGFNIGAILLESATREQIIEHLKLGGPAAVQSTVGDASTHEYEFSHVFLGEYRGFQLVVGMGAVIQWFGSWGPLSRNGRVLSFTLSENYSGANSFEFYDGGEVKRTYVEDGDEWSGEPLAIEAEMNKAEDHPADLVNRVFQDLTGGDGYAHGSFLDVPVEGWEFEARSLEDDD